MNDNDYFLPCTWKEGIVGIFLFFVKIFFWKIFEFEMLSKQMAYLMLQLLICPNFENPITFVYSFKSILFFFLFLFKHSNYLNYFLTVFSYLQFETHQKQKPKKHFLFYSLFVSWVLFLVLANFIRRVCNMREDLCTTQINS